MGATEAAKGRKRGLGGWRSLHPRRGGTSAGPQERTDGSGAVGHMLKMQCRGRDEEGMLQRDQDKTGTELTEGGGLALLSF